MTKLFQRSWALTVGTILLDGTAMSNDTLDIEFNITKTKKKEPNKADIKIYNLNATHRENLKDLETVGVELKAGYNDEMSMIFSGDLSDVYSERKGPDYITILEGEDGGDKYRNSRISRSFPSNTSVIVVLKAAVEGMGIGQGNLRDFSQINIRNMGTTYPEGTVLNGPARDEVNRIVRSIRDTDSDRTRYTWSIQNGNFQLRRGRQPVNTNALVISPNTGLVGSVTRNKPERNKPRTVDIQTLLIPGIFPGRVIVLNSSTLEGNFVVKDVSYEGSTFMNSWFCNITLEDF